MKPAPAADIFLSFQIIAPVPDNYEYVDIIYLLTYSMEQSLS
jgi:hypothetical protein